MQDNRDPEGRPDVWDHLDQQDSRCVTVSCSCVLFVFVLYPGTHSEHVLLDESLFNILVFEQGAAGLDGGPGARGQSVSISAEVTDSEEPL